LPAREELRGDGVWDLIWKSSLGRGVERAEIRSFDERRQRLMMAKSKSTSTPFDIVAADP